MIDFTTITIKRETKERLDMVGYKSESYDKLLNRILDVSKL